MTPSAYMHLMSLDTEEKLAKTRDMRLPQIVELLDMSETTHQKVCMILFFSFLETTNSFCL